MLNNSFDNEYNQPLLPLTIHNKNDNNKCTKYINNFVYFYAAITTLFLLGILFYFVSIFIINS